MVAVRVERELADQVAKLVERTGLPRAAVLRAVLRVGLRAAVADATVLLEAPAVAPRKRKG